MSLRGSTCAVFLSVWASLAISDLLGSITDPVSFRDGMQPLGTCSLPAPFHEVQIIPIHSNGCKRTLMRGKRFVRSFGSGQLDCNMVVIASQNVRLLSDNTLPPTR
jgi:hypothetical protein